jgi:hypothetical protein
MLGITELPKSVFRIEPGQQSRVLDLCQCVCLTEPRKGLFEAGVIPQGELHDAVELRAAEQPPPRVLRPGIHWRPTVD